MRIVACLFGLGLLLIVSLPAISPQSPLAVADEPKAAVDVVATAPQDTESPLSGFMHAKLDASNRILEGLVIDNMKKVKSGADALLQMSDAEQWRASNDMLYLQHSRTFRESVTALQEKAGRGSVDGVALAWMDVTLNCIRCHEWVRNVMIADGESIPTGLLRGE